MRSKFSILFCCLALIAKTQNVKFFSEAKNQGYIIYANNNEICPVSASVDFTLTNLRFSKGEQKIFVIPGKANRYKIGELDVINSSMYKYSSHFLLAYGDVTLKTCDSTFEYFLPFKKGKSFNVSQGYNGTISHKNENSIDFSMAEGTEITAARGGIVIRVVQNNNSSCPKEECMRFNNEINILHSDGTIAEYKHIKYNGSKVMVGDSVKQGDVIALSGNTGWSSGPHLHFDCYIARFDQRITLKTKFKINDGTQTVYLTEKSTYLRDY